MIDELVHVASCVSESEARTAQLAATCVDLCGAGEVVALRGPVGAGKTVFVRAACERLAVPREAGVCSPSYGLVHVYEGGRMRVAHLDLYRLEGDDALQALGFVDLLDDETLVFIEWSERAPLAEEVCSLRIDIADEGVTERRFDFWVRPSGSEKMLTGIRALGSPP